MENKRNNYSDLMSLSEASKITGLSADHLRRLVEHNQIWGIKIGRMWVTTQKTVEEYVNQKHPSGPKPKKS